MNKSITYLFLVTVICFLGFKTEAQNIPTLQDIVTKVKTNCLPEKSYDVDVTQSINAPSSSKIGKSIASGQMLRQNSFSTEYNPQNGLHIKKTKTVNKSINKSIASTYPQTNAGNVKIFVNLNTVFKDVDSWQNVNITPIKLNGANNFLITGKYSVIDFKIWVNSENYYVSRLDFSVSGHEFAQTDFNCKRVDNKYWLPSEVSISHTMDGSQITQHFGIYKFQ